jgi:hypothetical protein
VDAIERWAVPGRVRGVRVLEGGHARGPEAAQQGLRALYEKLIAPLEGSLGGIRRLFVVPDGKLTLAPLGALPDPQGHLLLERYSIAYLNSWRDPESWNSLPAKVAPPVIVANPDFDETFGRRR